jgi:ABC-2 type transport system permease protein
VTGFIFGLTLRQLLGRRSTLIPLGLCALPILISFIYSISNPEMGPERWTVRVLMVGFIITGILPLCTLPMATSVLGDELEEGTAVYLLTKPVPRWQILLPKLAAATLVSASMLFVATLLSGWLALHGHGDLSIVYGYAIAVIIADLAYTSLFVMLSLLTSRALIAGLIYVFIWETTTTSIFTGTRYLSIRHYALGIGEWLGNVPTSVYDAQVGGLLALGLATATIVITAAVANTKLEQIEVREDA